MMLRVALAAVVVALGFPVSSQAGDSGGAARSDDFWTKREASYREDARGPFTAFRADYLKPGESLTLYANADSVGIAPLADAASIRVALDENAAFHTEPTQSIEDPRLGRFLLSMDMQTPDLGRVLVYDPKLLDSHFHGFAVFPEDPKLRVVAKVTPTTQDTLVVGTTRGLEKTLQRAAVLSFERDGTACRLTGFREPGETGALFVPFQDATSAGESYGVGRYLRVDWKDGDPTAIVDFNHATNPWCAYSTYYNCILPPEENRLEVPIRAGEKAPEGAHP